MPKKVNLKTIAEDLGLSVGTISRVLNGKAKQFRISPKTVQLVLDYADEIGYAPNLIARGLQASKTYTIGLMIPDIANPFFGQMAKSIGKAAHKAGYSILLVDSDDDIEKEKQQIKNMINRKVDGIIVSPIGGKSEHFKAISRRKIPLVFIEGYFLNTLIPHVISDNYQGSLDAMDVFIKNGHQRIALIHGKEQSETIRERRKGYKDALVKAGIEIDEQLIVGNDYSIKNGYDSTMKLIKLNNPPTAIFAVNNLFGLGVLKALKEKNLNIPKDISLIIFDDQPYTAFLNPPITTVKLNTEKLSHLAIELILEHINNPELNSNRLVIPTNIIFRNSIRNIN